MTKGHLKINRTVFEHVAPSVPLERRLLAARGRAALLSDDLVTALYALMHDADAEVREAAGATFTALPERRLIEALSVRLDPAVIDKICETFGGREMIQNMVALSEGASDETLLRLAENGPDSVVEIISNSQRLFGNAELLSALKRNPAALSTALAVAELTFGEGAQAGAGPAPAALTGEDAEITEEESHNLYQIVQKMNVVEKIKLAMTGNKEARGLLIKDANKVIVRTVVRNPRITEDEIIKLTNSKTTADEILREIARNDEWTKNYHIKKGLVFNPKTPIAVAMRYTNFMYEKDMRELAKSRGVPNAVRAAARRILESGKFK